MARLGVLGGTFDPVHIGHLILGEAAREQLALDEVVFIPAGVQWRKASRTVSAAVHRLAMARLAVEGNPGFSVSSLDVDRPGPSYTADTLEQIMTGRPGTEVFFIVGQDALDDLPHWRRPERIIELATIAVATREVDYAVPRGEAALPGLAGRLVRIEMPEIGISATDIRERVAAGRSIRYLVPPVVEAYIWEHGLYA